MALSRKRIIYLFLLLDVIVGAVVLILLANAGRTASPSTGLDQSASSPILSTEVPSLTTEVVAEGLSNVWDASQAPDSTIFYTERANKIGAIINGKPITIHQAEGVLVKGEGGNAGHDARP